MKINRYILRIIFTAVFGLLALSCSKEGPYNTPKDEPAKNSKSKYQIIVSAERGNSTGKEPGTRAFVDLDDYQYWWEPGDRMIMSITHVNQPSSTIDGLSWMPLSAWNLSENVLHTTFLADLVQQQYEELMEAGADNFDYYSFFPIDINGIDNTASFPANLQFVMPNSYSLATNTFPDEKYAPMVAVVRDQAPEIFYTQDTDDPVYQLGGLHFDYAHILSYAAIEMDVRLLNEAVTSITMTVGSELNNNTRINGTMVYHPFDSTYTLSGGSNSVTINISGGGLIAGSGDAVYFPMPVKDLSGQTLTFTFTSASGNNSYREIKTSASGVNFERGKIHRIRLAPSAQYATGVQFTVTKTGFYYIEAWGGDGGTGGRSYQNAAQGAVGRSQKISGVYYLNKGVSLSLYIGSAGVSKTGSNQDGSGAGGSGGTNGLSYGSGGAGGQGYRHTILLGQYSGAGGGGGAGTFIFAGGTTLPDNVLIVSGGGGGSGGGSGNSDRAYSTGGAGGAGGPGGDTSGNGSQATNSGGAGSTTFNSGVNGGNGSNGGSGSIFTAPGGGGGGGGGGYSYGGNGGTGGQAGGNSDSKGGGGGKGGQSYITGTYTGNHGKILPVGNTRPNNNGHVIITFLR